MYIKNQHRQFRFSDFNQPAGLKMNPENRWVKKAAMIPWDELEDQYAGLFPSGTGNPAKPFRSYRTTCRTIPDRVELQEAAARKPMTATRSLKTKRP